MRTRLAALLLFSLFCLGAFGAEATSLNLIWTGTTGVGIPGSSAISVSGTEPETLTLDLVLNVDSSGLTLLTISAKFDEDFGDELNLLSAETLSWSNPKASGMWFGFGFISSQESGAASEGQIFHLDGGLGFGIGPQSATLTFARIIFATNPFRIASDGVDIFSFAKAPDDFGIDNLGLTTLPELGSASVNLIPEPASFALLALGVAVLGLSARRG